MSQIPKIKISNLTLTGLSLLKNQDLEEGFIILEFFLTKQHSQKDIDLDDLFEKKGMIKPHKHIPYLLEQADKTNNYIVAFIIYKEICKMQDPEYTSNKKKDGIQNAEFDACNNNLLKLIGIDKIINLAYEFINHSDSQSKKFINENYKILRLLILQYLSKPEEKRESLAPDTYLNLATLISTDDAFSPDPKAGAENFDALILSSVSELIDEKKYSELKNELVKQMRVRSYTYATQKDNKESPLQKLYNLVEPLVPKSTSTNKSQFKRKPS